MQSPAAAGAAPAAAPAKWSPEALVALLLAPPARPGGFVPMAEADIYLLCGRAREIFIEQPTLLELGCPLKVCGDIHGQYHDLIRIFESAGYPPEENFLFLGDYVDRGKQSLETICLLFAFKVLYPKKFFLLRGNHEEASINRIYGFYDECRRRYSVRLWKTFADVFNCMPIAALIETKVFCMHGGIPQIDELPSPFNFDMIRNLRRPITYINNNVDYSKATTEQRLVLDLLWADPKHPVDGYGTRLSNGVTPLERFEPSSRGVSHHFGALVLAEFLRDNNLDLILRAHEVAEDGYRFFGDPHAPKGCLTVFSAPNYTGEYENGAGILSLDAKMVASITVLSPPNRMRPIGEQYKDESPLYAKRSHV